MAIARRQETIQVQSESTLSSIVDVDQDDAQSSTRSEASAPAVEPPAATSSDGDEVETPPVEEGDSSLPCCLRPIVWAVFESMVHPSDDHVTRHRKLMLSCGLAISFVAIFGGVYNILTVGLDTNAAVVAVIAPFFLALLWIALYVVARSTGSATPALADIWVFFTWLGCIAISVSWTDWPANESFILLAIVACLFRTPRVPVHLFLCICGMVLSCYNIASYSRGPTEKDLLALQDPIMRHFASRFANSIASLLSALCVIAGLRAQVWESEQQSRHSRSQSKLVSSIAALISRYDTTRAASVIDEALRNDLADPEILMTFKTLVENLDQYRPHLPNWLLPELNAGPTVTVAVDVPSADSDELVSMDTHKLGCDVDGDDELVSISSGTSTPKERDHSRSTTSDRSTARRISSLTRVNSVSVNSSAGPAGGSSATPPTPLGQSVTVATAAHLRHKTPNGHGQPPTSVIPSLVTHTRAPPKMVHGVSTVQPVVFAKIVFDIRSAASRYTELINHLVDIVYRHAATTSAAVHSFVGDQIIVTWNAAVKTVQADAKAARFLARVQKDVANEGGISIAGGAFSGQARVQLGGMSGKQQSLSVTADWISALDQLVAVGRRYGSIVVDPTLRDNSSFACHVRAVAALEVPDWSASDRRIATVSNLPTMVPLRRLGAYEIIDERNEHEDGEWMYVLAKVAEASGTADTTTAKAIKTATECLDQWLRCDGAIPAMQMMDIDAWLVSQAQHGAKDSAILSEIVQAMRKSGTATRLVRPDTFRL